MTTFLHAIEPDRLVIKDDSQHCYTATSAALSVCSPSGQGRLQGSCLCDMDSGRTEINFGSGNLGVEVGQNFGPINVQYHNAFGNKPRSAPRPCIILTFVRP